MKLSNGLEVAVSLAAREAQRRHHEWMTVEHLLFALSLDEDTKRILSKSGANIKKLRTALEEHLQNDQDELPEDALGSPEPSRGFQRVLQRAAWHVESSGKEELRGINVVIAMFAEEDSVAAHILEESGTSRLDIISYLSHGTTADGESSVPELEGEEEEAEPDPLEKYTKNLNEAARNGELEPVGGGEKEMIRASKMRARRRNTTPLMGGPAGEGKPAS
ncbi:MAG: ATP-dependent Clp protease ATP-binding subunit ClpA, partial [Polyangiaceae bacterium]|nr:ATP-dependent Clp protease ATP-binding subunit ClpA [Polyangiaceae bacterium]